MTNPDLVARITTPDRLGTDEMAAWEKFSIMTPGLSTPFLSHQYVRAVWEAGMDARICVLYREGMIHGFFPYQFRNHFSRWTGTAEPVGGEMTDYFGLIAEPGFRITPDQLLQLAQLNYLGFTHLDESQINYGLKGEKPRSGLRIKLDQSSEHPLDALLADRSKYRKDSERRARQLSRDIGPIKFTFDVNDGREAALNHLISQKRAQYKRTSVSDVLKDSWKNNLLHKLSKFQFHSCRGLLSTLYAGEKWVASHFGIMGNGVLQYWLPVYNPDFAKYAPGRLLIHHIIEAGRSAALHTIDRGEGDSPSKRELANDEHQFYRGVWHNQSVASQVTRSIQGIKWRLGV